MSMQCSPAELRALEAVVYSEMGVFGKPHEGWNPLKITIFLVVRHSGIVSVASLRRKPYQG
jgi:hypothetical protein